MHSRAFRCPNCGATLGQLVDRHNQHGRRRTRLRLNNNTERVGRSLFRGKWAECVCGEKVRLPDEVTVEFH